VQSGAQQPVQAHRSGEMRKMLANLKTGSLAGTRQNLPLMVLVAVYWALALLDPVELSGDAAEAVYYTQSLAWLAFVLIHGSKRYGWDNLFIFFGITFLVSWSIESVSIVTGSPFGNYYYTDLLGARIGAVPLAVPAAYFVAGYLAWTMGTIFLGELGTGIEGKSLFLVPAIASLIMVMWDLCLDPIKSTIEGAWVWEGGGAYHGVPITNYFGWYLTGMLIYQLFALYLHRFSPNKPVTQTRTYWTLAPVMYLGLALPYLLNPFYQTEYLEIYWSSFLVCAFSMVVASVLSAVSVRRMDAECFQQQ
jgi:uncharacterized membrane protein